MWLQGVCVRKITNPYQPCWHAVQGLWAISRCARLCCAQGLRLRSRPIHSCSLCWHAAESPDNQGKRRLRSRSKAGAGVSSPGIAEELQVRRSKRKSRQTVESSDDDGDGQPASKRHLDLQANDKVCIICLCISVLACTAWYAA